MFCRGFSASIIFFQLLLSSANFRIVQPTRNAAGRFPRRVGSTPTISVRKPEAVNKTGTLHNYSFCNVPVCVLSLNDILRLGMQSPGDTLSFFKTYNRLGKQVFQSRKQPVYLYRFGDMGVHTRTQRFAHIFGKGIGRHGNYGDTPCIRTIHPAYFP